MMEENANLRAQLAELKGELEQRDRQLQEVMQAECQARAQLEEAEAHAQLVASQKDFQLQEALHELAVVQRLLRESEALQVACEKRPELEGGTRCSAMEIVQMEWDNYIQMKDAAMRGGA